ncbi:hypothetical protein SCHPADRAFT_908197 [Schizopora paradoxa]|uniref:Uncharacterized protein n=1 Tax=Schizopora paradoxa TaxID=27342 RepID=A0A0H2RHH6_9AGAM|nr:hypothetical protein SCHPADRAFT_908197 [Schizopora paradoxa]
MDEALRVDFRNQSLLSRANTTPPFVWVPSSTNRGTYQIFSLCASTTVICIWSAVHRDIPPRRLTGLRSTALQALWVLLAFFLPEFLFLYALKQFLDARRLVRKYSKHHNTLSAIPSRKPRHWFSFRERHIEKENNSTQLGDLEDIEGLISHDIKTYEVTHPSFELIHAFYATMGGYVFDVVAPADEADSKDERIRTTIKPAGVHFLMEHDPNLTSDFSPSSITARSKSNGLNKALLIVQLSWFCMSCVSRLAEHLPLTLLEVVTAAHGLCTLAMYAAWWHKPLNVKEPTLLTCECAREAFAFLRMVDRGDISPLIQESSSVLSVDHEPKSNSQTELALALRAMVRYGLSYAKLQSMKGQEYLDAAPTNPSILKIMSDLLDRILESSDLTGKVAESEVGNFEFLEIVCLPAVYGSVHLFGWNARFPTSVERILWRIATVIICSCGAVLSAFLSVFVVSSRVSERARSTKVIFISLQAIFICIPISYLLSTLYLLIESVRQLFYLSPDAFVVASWSGYLPHFS